MDSDFSAKLQGILSNPEAMKMISGIANNLNQNPAPQEEKPVAAADNPLAASAPSAGSGVADNIAAANNITGLVNNLSASDTKKEHTHLVLLKAIKPLVRDEKRKKIDSLTSLLSVAGIFKNMKGGFFNV